MKAWPFEPRRRFPRQVAGSVAMTTGGACVRDHTAAHIRSPAEFRLAMLAGGPLDAPGWMPAGSWNSTYAVCGPWDSDGTGRACPSETMVQREIIIWSEPGADDEVAQMQAEEWV